jgi:hypothetical protein
MSYGTVVAPDYIRPGTPPTDTPLTFCNSALQGGTFFPPASTMKLFVQSTIIFFGTLLAAGLVALGEPGTAEVQMAHAPATAGTIFVALLGLDD